MHITCQWWRTKTLKRERNAADTWDYLITEFDSNLSAKWSYSNFFKIQIILSLMLHVTELPASYRNFEARCELLAKSRCKSNIYFSTDLFPNVLTGHTYAGHCPFTPLPLSMLYSSLPAEPCGLNPLGFRPSWCPREFFKWAYLTGHWNTGGESLRDLFSLPLPCSGASLSVADPLCLESIGQMLFRAAAPI